MTISWEATTSVTGVMELVHGLIHFVDCKTSVNLLHRIASIFHGIQGFLIDVCSFNRVYLLFDLGDLCCGLLEILLVDLLPPEGCSSNCKAKTMSVCL